jgi:hypothetical protein
MLLGAGRQSYQHTLVADHAASGLIRLVLLVLVEHGGFKIGESASDHE